MTPNSARSSDDRGVYAGGGAEPRRGTLVFDEGNLSGDSSHGRPRCDDVSGDERYQIDVPVTPSP